MASHDAAESTGTWPNHPPAGSERWEFKIGVPVEADFGPIGRLRQVVLNPGDGRVAALVVRRPGLPARDVVLPVEAVEEASDDVIRLKPIRGLEQTQPLIQRERYIAAPSGAGGYTSDQALYSLVGRGRPTGSEQATEGQLGSPAMVIRAGERVVATDGEVGRVEHVLVDSASRRATHFTVRKGLLLRKDIMVPVEWIAEWQPDVIKLGVDKATLERLPAYRPDQELQWAVEDALYSDRRLVDEVLSLYPITVTVHDGVVTLIGRVRNTEQKQRAEAIAAGVRGVLGVRNFLIADDELEREIARALAQDPRTRDLNIRVNAWFGYVHLDGEVPTREARIVAEEVAASVPGVEEIVNLLYVTGLPSPWQLERLRELSTGQPVYAGDTVIGHVERLLMDPRTWRITAIVVRPEEGEAVIVPVDRVESTSLAAVRLNLTEEEVKRLPRYDPSNYPPPDQAWRPPAPYRREDVALDLTAMDQRSGAGGQSAGRSGQEAGASRTV